MPNRSVVVRFGVEASAYFSGVSKMEAVTASAAAGIKAQMTAAGSSIDQLGGKAQSVGSKIDTGLRKGSTSAKSLASDMNQAGSSFTHYGAAAIAGFGLAAKAAISWESAFTGVTKTVDDSAEGYNQLEKDLRGLATTLPETHEQIAAVAEAAGQLGVARKDLVPFVKTMVELGDTTNLTSDEAATSLAQLMNVMGTSGQDVGRLGSTIVDLGNKGASTERDIVQMAQRISGAGKQIGLSEQEVLGFASAIASTGINVEAGGTAISKSFLKIDDAVRKGGDKLDVIAKTSGVSAEQFRKDWGTDAGSASVEFINGLAKVQASGGSVSQVLGEIGITGQYERDVMTRLANATKVAGAQTDLLSDSLGVANTAWGQNTALTQEAEKRYSTTASQVQVAWNKIKDASIDAGASLLPVVADIAEGVGKITSAFSDLPDGVQEFIVKAAGVAGVALLVSGGALKITSSYLQVRSALQGISETSPGAISGLRGVAGVAGPVALALAAVSIALEAVSKYETQIGSGEQIKAQLLSLAEGGDAASASLKNLDAAFPKPNVADAFVNSISPISSFQKPVDGLSDALHRVTNEGFGSNNFFAKIVGQLTPGQQAYEKMTAGITATDQALADLVTSGNAKGAAGAFKQIADANKDIAPADLVEQFGSYRDSLLKISDAAGVTSLSAQELSDWMGGKVPAAVSKAAAANPQLKTQLDATSTAAQKQVKTLDQVISGLFAYSNAMLQVSGGAAGLEAAIDAGNDALKANGKTLDLNTAKGRANQAALDGVASAALSNAESMTKAGASQEALNTSASRARDNYARLAHDMGLSKTAARDLADSIIKIPKATDIRIVTEGAKLSKDDVATLNRELKSIPKEQRAKIVTIAETKGAKAAEAAMARVKDKQVIARSKGDLKGAKDVAKAQKDLKDRLVQAKIRGDDSGARKIAAAQKALKDRTVTAKVVDSGISAVQSRINNIHGTTITVNVRENKIGTVKGTAGATGGMITHEGFIYRAPVRRSNGGPVWGAGSATSDSIEALLSNGEFVQRQKAVEKYGIGVMSAINNLQIPKEAFTPYGYAGGGLVNGYASGGTPAGASLADIMRVIVALRSPLAELRQYAVAASRAQKASFKPTRAYGRALARYQDAVSDRDDIKDRVNRLKREADATKGITKADRELRRARNDLADANARVSKTSREKTKVTAAYTKAMRAANEATAKLRAAQKELADNARAYSSALAEPYRSASTDAADWLDSMKQGAVDVAAFNKQIADLRKRGLSETLIQQIIAQGATNGSQTAASILGEGSSFIKQLNASNAALQKAADALGLLAATGKVKKAGGGQVFGPGGPKDDMINAALSNREWVQPVESVDYYGEGFMDAIQHRRIPRQQVRGFAAGGQYGSPIIDYNALAQSVHVTAYVQNPWTAEYHEARMSHVAAQTVNNAVAGAGRSR